MVDFYLPISKIIIIKLLKFAGSFTSVPNEDLSLIEKTPKSQYFEQENLWRKKRRDNILTRTFYGYRTMRAGRTFLVRRVRKS